MHQVESELRDVISYILSHARRGKDDELIISAMTVDEHFDIGEAKMYSTTDGLETRK